MTTTAVHVGADYFEARTSTNPETGCWEWQLKKGWDGYGMCYVIRDITVMAHRVAYMALRGPIPDGMTLDHLCRNRACVNPDHLEPVTGRENTLRAPGSQAAINAAKTECNNGHPYTPENTYQHKGHRSCRACNRAAVARYVRRRAGGES